MKIIDFFYKCEFHGFMKRSKMLRVILFLLLASVLQTYANDTYAEKTKLSLNYSNTKLIDVFDEIEDLSEFYFLFNENLVDTDREVSISFENLKINKILDILFSDTDVVYTITDRKIVLTPGFLAENPQQQKSISGAVTDEFGQPMTGVTVLVKGTTNGTITVQGLSLASSAV